MLYWTDAEDFSAAVRPFRDRFNSTFTGTATPILNSAATLAMATSGDYLPVVLITRQHAATLKYLRQQLPALRKQRLRPEESFLFGTTGPTGPVILVNTHDPAQLTAAAELLKQQGHLNLKQPLVPLK